MNHFMLPNGGHSSDADASRFGVHAMDLLIGAMSKAGADRRRLVAKIFGGAHVLDIRESVGGVPQQNIDFIRDFLTRESLPLLSEDVGGYHPRHVHFYTETGRAMVKRVSSARSVSKVVREERQREVQAPRYGDVTLFE
jgi:chemotaxis protein CheD